MTTDIVPARAAGWPEANISKQHPRTPSDSRAVWWDCEGDFHNAKDTWSDWVRRDRSMTLAARLIALEVASRISFRDGQVTLPQRVICRAVGLAETSIRRSLREAVGRGWLTSSIEQPGAACTFRLAAAISVLEALDPDRVMWRDTRVDDSDDGESS